MVSNSDNRYSVLRHDDSGPSSRAGDLHTLPDSARQDKHFGVSRETIDLNNTRGLIGFHRSTCNDSTGWSRGGCFAPRCAVALSVSRETARTGPLWSVLEKHDDQAVEFGTNVRWTGDARVGDPAQPHCLEE